MKKYLNMHYFSSYLKNPDFVYALLYSRGYIRKSHSVSVESVYITNLTEDAYTRYVKILGANEKI